MFKEPQARNVVIAFVLVVIAIVVAAWLLLSTQPEPVQITINPPLPTATPEPSATPGPILVYVTGAVAEPETTVELPAGSRVQDAIDAAGGVVGEIDGGRVNPLGILRDGDHVHVYALGEDDAAVAVPTASDEGIVYVNTATLEELDTLPEIGPALAQRIIDYREANGPFPDLESLGEVSGIGEAVLEGLAGLVAFD